jgi:ribosomal protein L19
LFAKGSPDAIEPGSVVVVEQLSSRSSPRKLVFAGVLLAIKRKGILSSITVRNYVLSTGVEMVFPIYSPMVAKIKVLKKVDGFSGGNDQVYFLRDRPSMAPMAFNKIDDMVMRDTEAEKRKEANRKLK